LFIGVIELCAGDRRLLEASPKVSQMCKRGHKMV
jgi:hypothetical protein